MKRLTFKPIWVPKVQSGEKFGTTRWRNQHLKVGDIVSATTSEPGKPAFLVKAENGFEVLEILEARTLFFWAYTEDMARACGFASLEDARAFYLIEKPDAGDFSRMWFYRFRLAELTTLGDEAKAVLGISVRRARG